MIHMMRREHYPQSMIYDDVVIVDFIVENR